MGEDPVQLGKIYHNKEFYEKCESIGLHPKLNEGYHLKLANGPFQILMDELGIEKPVETERLPPELEIDWFKWFFKDRKKGKIDFEEMDLSLLRAECQNWNKRRSKTKAPHLFLVPGDEHVARD